MSLLGGKERIAVFRGGERATNRQSMEYGATVLALLSRSRRYTPVDVVVAPNGEWLHDGLVVSPTTFLPHVDAAYLTVLGPYGEDGQLARVLEQHGVPHQTEKPYTALETWQKDLATERVRSAGVRIPQRLIAHAHSQSDLHGLSTRIQELFGPTYVVKPVSGTQRDSVYLVANGAQLPAVIAQVLSVHPACLIEEYIDGQAVTLASMPGMRGEKLYHTPLLQWQHQFATDGVLENNEVLQPAALSREHKRTVAEIADNVYKALDLTGSVRTDFQVTPAGQVYFLETNTLAPLTAESALTQTLNAVGITPEEFVLTQVRALR
ncbi:hypothetical protein CL655_03355 [bacterium]|nr:hypothetical protein [bacterium]|tara:strand:+ start:17825 stop:18790 length:966 start_codon:yes stop_codon:yes gene_type:complete